jgi:hypothetical protein
VRQSPALTREVAPNSEAGNRGKTLTPSIDAATRARRHYFPPMNDQQQLIETLQKEVAALRRIIARAKDATPVSRPSLKRVAALAATACMSIRKISGGWLLSMGNLCRSFRKLTEIWELLTQEEWLLSDIFPQMNMPEIFKPRLKRRNPVLASYPATQHKYSVNNNEALKILSDRPSIESDRRKDLLNHLIIQAITMFPVKVTPTRWINLSSISDVQINSDRNIRVIWNWGEPEDFTGDAAKVIIKSFENARKHSIF